jgi:hypothetical protein
MKRLLGILALAIIASCSKTDITENNSQVELPDQPTTCDFGITNFNLTKRAPIVDPELGNKLTAGRETETNTPSTATPPGVIYLDFDGQVVSNTNWNTTGNIVCAPANLSAVNINEVFQRVVNDYSPFNMVITTDEAVYNSATANRRMRVILTESWEWFGQAGGTAFRGSFIWGDNTPCFVFTSLLNWNTKNIAEAASHEAGHTLGLRHQSTYNGTILTSAYNYGIGTGEIAWAPIMGCSYYRNVSTWHNGPTDISSFSYQNDVVVIKNVVGPRADDHANTIAGATTLASSTSGFINTAGDVDYFSVNIPTTKTLSAVPFNVAPGNEGSNTDIVVRIYNSSGILINTIDTEFLLSATTTLNAGQYYISISSISNKYSTTYGMMGKYTVSLL